MIGRRSRPRARGRGHERRWAAVRVGVVVAMALLLSASGRVDAARKKHASSPAAARSRAAAHAGPSSPATSSSAARRSATSHTQPKAQPITDVGASTTAVDSDVRAPVSERSGGASGEAAPPSGPVKPAKTKVYTFGAMDVEGKLKTPQLLYFLNRIKLELEMSASDQRSFMKELARTADDPNL